MVQSFSARLGTAQTFSNPAYENANQRDGELEGVLGGLAAATDDGELYDVQDGVGGAGEENYEDPDQATYEDPDAPAAKTAAKTKTAGHLAPSAVGGDQPNYEDIDEAQGNYEVIPTVPQVPGAAADDGQPNYEDLDANIAPGGAMNDQNYMNVSTAVGGENYGTLDAVAARAGGATSYDHADSSGEEDLDDTYNTVTEFVAAKTNQPSRTGSVHVQESAESLYLSQAAVATTAETSLSQPAGVDTGYLTLGSNSTNNKPYSYGSSSEEDI